MINNQKEYVKAECTPGIITVWHIETFEGGSGSRKKFLMDAAYRFEKQNPNVLIMVLSHTVYSAEESMKKGNMPDLISYSNGINVKDVYELHYDKDFKGGKVGDKTYATPWCRGGYAVIGNPKLIKDKNFIEKITVCKGEYDSPLIGLLLDGIKASETEVLPPGEGYMKFVTGKTPCLLGTQREINKLINRGMEISVKPIENFNDLYQYISVCSDDVDKRYISEEFVRFILSKEEQSRLTDIGMLSAFYDLEYQGFLADMQNKRDFLTISPFTDKDTLTELHDLSLSAIKGDKNAEIKIKNMIV